MANYGPLYASFYDDDFNLITDTKVYHLPNYAIGRNTTNQSGGGRFSMKLTTNVANMVKHGNYVVIYVHSAIASNNLLVCAFKINSLETETHDNGMTTLTASGYDELDELRLAYPHTRNIGAAFNTTLTYNAAIGTTEIALDDIGSVETTIANQNTHTGEDHVRIASSTGFAVGDDVAIELNSPHGTHTTSITAIQNNIDGYLSFYLNDNMPHGADIGLRVVKPEIFAGDDIRITLDDGSYHRTKIDGTPGINEVSLKEVVTGDDATAGNAVRVHSSKLVDTSDITSIMAYATLDSWTLDMETGTGTANGTAHSPDGTSTLQLLVAAQKASGEFFRIKRTSFVAPSRTLEWRRTSDSSGVTLVRDGSVANVTNANKGIIKSIKRSAVREIYTYMIATPNSDDFNLGDATDNDLSGNATYSQEYISNPPTWRIVHDANEAAYNPRWLVRKYDITPDSESQASKTAAADALQSAALADFAAAEARSRTFDVVATVHKPLSVGQTIIVDYVEPGSLADYSGTYYIAKLEPFVGPHDNVYRVKLHLSEDALYRKVDDTQVVAAGLGGSSGSSVISGGGSGSSSSGGSTHDPVTLGTITPTGAITLTDQELSFDSTSDGVTNPQKVLATDASGYVSAVRIGAGVASPTAPLDVSGNGYVSGNFGIGTTSPSGKLHVDNIALGAGVHFTGVNARNDALLTLEGTGAGGGSTDTDRGLLIDYTAGGNVGYLIRAKESSSTVFSVNTDGHAYIDSRLGIGVTPSYPLHTSGESYFGGTTYINGDLSLLNSLRTLSAANGLNITAGGSANITLQTLLGNVVVDPIISGDLLVNTNLRVNIIRDYSGGNVVLQDDSGNVGVGTSPSYKLHVSGNVGFDGDLTFVGAQQITTSADSLTIAPAADLVLNAGGGQMLVNTNTDLEGESWSSGWLGSQWGIDTGLGHIDARSAYFDELRVTLFSADETLVVAGTHYVSPGMAKVSRDFTIPAVSSTGTLYLRDSEALADTPVFRDGDYVMIRVKDTTGGGLTLANIWGQVSSYTDLTGGDDGEQTWTFTTRSLGAAVGGNTVPAESIVLGFGKSGDGWIMSTTNDLAGSPYTTMRTWEGNPYTAANRTEHIRLGNLNGISGIGEEFGLYAGLGPNLARLVLTDSQAGFYGIPVRMYHGTNDGGYLRIYALELNSDVETSVSPDGDISQDGILRSSGSGTWFSHINEAPHTGQPDTQWIYNTPGKNGSIWFNVADISHTLTTLEIEVYGTTHDFADDACQIRAQLFKSDGVTELTDEVRVFTQDSTDGTHTVQFTGIVPAGGNTWSNAQLRLRWIYNVSTTGASEVVRLEPSMETGPYLAIGSTLPTGFRSGGDGMWMGRDPSDGLYKARFGGASSSGLPAFVWNGSTVGLVDSDDTTVIRLDSSGNSEFAGVMTIDTNGMIRQGTGTWGSTFDGIAIYNNSDVGTFSTYTNGDEIVRHDENGISIKAVDKFSAGSIDWFDTLGGTNEFSVGVDVDLGSIVGGYLETNDLPLAISASSITFYDSVTAAGIMYLDEGDVWVDGGMDIGDFIVGSANTGQLRLNQGSNDSSIVELRSSDISHSAGIPYGLSAGSDVWGAIRKASPTQGGLFINGFTEGVYGAWLAGWATTGDSSTSSGSLAATVLQGYVGGINVGATNNVLAVRSGPSTRLVLKGDGDLWHQGTNPPAADKYDDAALLRTFALEAFDPTTIIKNEFDNFLQYNRQTLIDLGVLAESGFYNSTGLIRLLIGAVGQLNNKIQLLERKI